MCMHELSYVIWLFLLPSLWNPPESGSKSLFYLLLCLCFGGVVQHRLAVGREERNEEGRRRRFVVAFRPGKRQGSSGLSKPPDVIVSD